MSLRKLPVPCAHRLRLHWLTTGMSFLVLMSGCGSIVAVNQSPSTVNIRVDSFAGEEGAVTTRSIHSGDIEIHPGGPEAFELRFIPYAISSPGNQSALLRLDAGNGRVERAFIPFDSTGTVTVAPDGSLDLGIAPIPDDGQLRDELTARIPGLKLALLATDKRIAANLLLNWIANNVDDALVDQDTQNTLPIVVKKNVAYSYHELFRRDRGAVVCGGYAVMLQKLLLSFEIDALIIDFGDLASGLTHMSVLIPQQATDGTWRFYQFDPKLNFRCADSMTGRLLDLFEVMDRELIDRFDTVEILQGSNADRDFVGTSAHLNDAHYQFNRAKGPRYFYRRPDYSLLAHVTDYHNQFVNGGFTPGIAGFFELMQVQFYTVRLGNNQTSRNAFVQELSNRRIPLIYPNFQ